MPVDPVTAGGAAGYAPATPGAAAPGAAGPANEFAVAGPEWDVGRVTGLGPDAGPSAAPPAEQGFGGMLAHSVGQLQATQDEAAGAAQALATGQASDVSAVVMAVERAKLSMQLASQIRNKAVEAYHEIFRTQV
jgi:flagellar hook-basal body complex protein FliE